MASFETLLLNAYDEAVESCNSAADMRAHFFGPEASTDWAVKQLRQTRVNYVHPGIDMRDSQKVKALFSTDNIPAADLIAAIDAVYRNPGPGGVCNMGGGRRSNCSMLEAIELSEKLVGGPFGGATRTTTGPATTNGGSKRHPALRGGADYPEWMPVYDIEGILRDILERAHNRW